MSKKPTFVYLASPYSDPDHRVRQRRHDAVLAAVCRLRTPETLIFSPIVASHSYVLAGAKGSWEDWEVEDRHAILARDELWIYRLPGWGLSAGVQCEITIARDAGKTICNIDPTEEEMAILYGELT